ncbi:MAG: helix-turn-helix domain-containing protein [Herpetosiphon sp.]
MDPQQLIIELGRLGLNTYEAKAYIALLDKDSFSAARVSERSGVPRQRIYDILSSLIELGMVVAHPGRGGTRYAAVAPAAALASLLSREQQRLQMLEQATASLTETLMARFSLGQTANAPLEYIQILRGASAITERFSEIQTNCQREILVLTKPPYARSFAENVDEIDMLKRQIRACSIYEYDALSDPATRDIIRSFIDQGEDARFVEYLPLKLAIVDEEIVMFAMQDPIAGSKDLTIMVIEQRQVAQTMKLAFGSLWQQGMTFQQACTMLPLPA